MLFLLLSLFSLCFYHFWVSGLPLPFLNLSASNSLTLCLPSISWTPLLLPKFTAKSPNIASSSWGLITALHCISTLELWLRVFHYYFITQVSYRIKWRGHSALYSKALRWDRDTSGARLSGSRCTELLYQESLSTTVCSLQRTVVKQVAEMKTQV